jgi:hypothetical protein
LSHFRGTFVTTWPVLTEAFHFVDEPWNRSLLWDFVLSRAVDTVEIARAGKARMRQLMEQYADLPMDFADASLLMIAEQFKLNIVFTLDRRGFTVYRARRVHSFEIIP